jgi:C4-dicarboxylate-specific signal transduction histidine kinase
MSTLRVTSNAPSHSPDMPSAPALGTIVRYVLPFVAVAVACGATSLLDIAAPESPNLFLFFASIVIAAWFAGAGPGWLAVVLSIVAVDYFYLPPIHVLDLSVKDTPWVAAFAACAAATNALSLQRRRIEAMLRQAHNELEQRVRERTIDLQQSNDKLIAATTERALAEAALRETQNELARIARIMTVTELTASIAHEVNQPLAAVVANGEAALNWLKRSPPAICKAEESIAAIVLAGERASTVISRIRSLMTNGAPTLTTVDMNELISGVTTLVEASLVRRNIMVTCRLEPGPSPILGDRVQLQQLLLNLISNAADAMAHLSDRDRDLVIKTRRMTGDTMTITVEDTGHGLADVDTMKLFQPFYSTKQNGMGMGLSICRTIVDSHGGTIRAAPRSPHGAVFQVDLPLRTSV